jgi:hypothetical protein
VRPGRPGRRALLGAAASLLLLTAGCGGSSSDDAAADRARTAYAKQVDAYCSDVRSATEDFQRAADSLRASTTPSTVARRFGDALEDLADGFADGTADLRGAKPPEAYADFNAQAVRALREATTRLRSVARSARSGDADALSAVGSQLGDLRVPDAPEQLLRDAPSCRAS